MGLWDTYFSLYFGQENHIFLAILEALCGLKHAENAIADDAPPEPLIAHTTLL